MEQKVEANDQAAHLVKWLQLHIEPLVDLVCKLVRTAASGLDHLFPLQKFNIKITTRKEKNRTTS